MIHRHAFAWKCSMPAMNSIPQTATNIVKYVKSHCTTGQKVAGSIPYSVVGIFHWHYSSGRTMAMRSTQPLINEYQGCLQGVNWPLRRDDNLTTFMCVLSRNSGSIFFQACKGTVVPLPLTSTLNSDV